MAKRLPFLEAIAVCVGTTIGAGILGIPYVVAKAGFLTGVIVLIVIAFALLMNNLFLGEIVLSTEKRYQLTGYANKYLGTTGKYAMLVAALFGFYGALLAYIIGEGKILAALTNGNALVYSLIFFMFGSVLIYLGLAVVKRIEFIMTLVILVIVLIISGLSFRVINVENLWHLDLSQVFLPYGVILFALTGSSAVPLLKFVLKGKERLMKKAVTFGLLIPAAVYLLFTLAVIGVTGINTTEIATVGLGLKMGEAMVIAGNIFALFTMATSFLTIGLALKETYFFDLRLNYKLSWLLTCLPPLIVFLLGLNNFVKIIGTVGALGGGLEGLLVLAIYSKLRLSKKTERQPEYKIFAPGFLVALLSLIYVGGIIYTLWFLM